MLTEMPSGLELCVRVCVRAVFGTERVKVFLVVKLETSIMSEKWRISLRASKSISKESSLVLIPEYAKNVSGLNGVEMLRLTPRKKLYTGT